MLTGTVTGGAFQVSGTLNDASVDLIGVFDPYLCKVIFWCTTAVRTFWASWFPAAIQQQW